MLTNHLSLRLVLRLNAFSCIAFGTIFMAMPRVVSDFLGGAIDASSWIFWIGILLFVNGMHLIAASMRRVLWPIEVIYFVLGDVLWVAGSFALLGFTPWIASKPGQVATLVVALMVGLLGYFQWKFLHERKRDSFFGAE